MDGEYTLPETSPNGHTLSVIKIKNQKKSYGDSADETFSTLPDKNISKVFSGSFKIIGEKGFSIISDIDDTIKESNVLDKKELVKNTFIRKFRPVNGMSDLYRKFGKKDVSFHYVSGSPWQLYPAINKFLSDEQFPGGAVELKLFRVKDKSAINFITADQLEYKVNSIKTIINRFPKRKFILIGDSGEKDPEVYSEIADQYKDKIRFIFIRDVGLIEENSSRRKSVIGKAGNVKVIIFKEAGELTPFLKKL
jgi:phosphatidate phosphatase APP1